MSIITSEVNQDGSGRLVEPPIYPIRSSYQAPVIRIFVITQIIPRGLPHGLGVWQAIVLPFCPDISFAVVHKRVRGLPSHGIQFRDIIHRA